MLLASSPFTSPGAKKGKAFSSITTPDHLGSSNYISDACGEVYQHEEYFQFGETFVEERNTEYTPYLFNGKELDEETGLYYYGARYYDPRTSIWQSVDPNAEKYYEWSPYAYTFDDPIKHIDPDGRDGVVVVFPDYKIQTPLGKIGGLGHAGVLLIDNKTGFTKYYEYGRYDKEGKGIVRSFAVSNVKIGKDGKPTLESLNKVMKQISDKAGHGGKIEGAYIKSDKFKEMNNYAQDKMKENNNPKREEYSLMDNNCGTFANDVVKKDEEVKKEAPKIIDPRPTSIIDEYQNKFQNMKYDPKTNKTTLEE